MAATTAASDGSKAPAPAPERPNGMARVLEGQAWRTASIAHDAAFEAERLCSDIYHAISDAYQPRGDSKAAELAASKPIHDKAREAIRCLHAAAGYLNDLTGYDEPPF